MAKSLAVVVLPKPGSPLNKAALEFKLPEGIKPLWGSTDLEFPLITTSYQSESHYLSCLIWAPYPITSSKDYGLYF